MTPTATHSLSLQHTDYGWGLYDAHGDPVFVASGRDARRQCLARAAELGILHLRFDEQPRLRRSPHAVESASSPMPGDLVGS